MSYRLARRPGFLLVLFVCAVVPMRAQGNIAEHYLLAAANEERVSRGLAPLEWDAALAAAAALHARAMAERGTISHRFEGEADLAERGASSGARFSLIAENVAEGPLATTIHGAWMLSSGHRANLLDAKLGSVGIAAVVRDRQLYVVQDFARVTPKMALEEQEAAVGRWVAQRGVHVSMKSTWARSLCALQEGHPRTQRAGFAVRYTVGVLSDVPVELTRELASKRYREAEIGACEESEPGEFSGYRIAVLLYP